MDKENIYNMEILGKGRIKKISSADLRKKHHLNYIYFQYQKEDFLDRLMNKTLSKYCDPKTRKNELIRNAILYYCLFLEQTNEKLKEETKTQISKDCDEIEKLSEKPVKEILDNYEGIILDDN